MALARAGPMLGRVSSSAWVAVFRLTGPPGSVAAAADSAVSAVDPVVGRLVAAWGNWGVEGCVLCRLRDDIGNYIGGGAGRLGGNVVIPLILHPHRQVDRLPGWHRRWRLPRPPHRPPGGLLPSAGKHRGSSQPRPRTPSIPCVSVLGANSGEALPSAGAVELPASGLSRSARGHSSQLHRIRFVLPEIDQEEGCGQQDARATRPAMAILRGVDNPCSLGKSFV